MVTVALTIVNIVVVMAVEVTDGMVMVIWWQVALVMVEMMMATVLEYWR